MSGRGSSAYKRHVLSLPASFAHVQQKTCWHGSCTNDNPKHSTVAFSRETAYCNKQPCEGHSWSKSLKQHVPDVTSVPLRSLTYLFLSMKKNTVFAQDTHQDFEPARLNGDCVGEWYDHYKSDMPCKPWYIIGRYRNLTCWGSNGGSREKYQSSHRAWVDNFCFL